MIGLFRGLSLKCKLRAVAFLIVLLVCFSTAGCANSCIVAVLNPGGTVIGVTASNLPLACPPPIKKTSVKVLARVTTLCGACSASNRIQGLFLTLVGIELHAKTRALGDTSEWLELFPDLEKRPRQLDLLSLNTDTSASGLLGESAAIPPGIYDQVRLRLVQNRGDAEAQFLTGNACGVSGFNCMTMADGHVYGLQLASDPQELRIASEGLSSGLLYIASDGNEELLIRLVPVWSTVGSFPEAVRFLPVLTGTVVVEQSSARED
jgi:uncharacterized protein DUF4382